MDALPPATAKLRRAQRSSRSFVFRGLKMAIVSALNDGTEGRSPSLMDAAWDEASGPLGKSRDYAPERSIAFSRPAIGLLRDNGGRVEDISLAIDGELRALTDGCPESQAPSFRTASNHTS